jgi:D-hexose-6-phosphate mutarotase
MCSRCRLLQVKSWLVSFATVDEDLLRAFQEVSQSIWSDMLGLHNVRGKSRAKTWPLHKGETHRKQKIIERLLHMYEESPHKKQLYQCYRYAKFRQTLQVKMENRSRKNGKVHRKHAEQEYFTVQNSHLNTILHVQNKQYKIQNTHLSVLIKTWVWSLILKQVHNQRINKSVYISKMKNTEPLQSFIWILH